MGIRTRRARKHANTHAVVRYVLFSLYGSSLALALALRSCFMARGLA